MAAFVEVRSGAAAGKRLALTSGKALRIGRVESADLIIRDDPMMSNLHFAVEWDRQTCRLRDLNSRFGTRVNRKKTTEAVLKDGDEVVAGGTTFVLRLEPEAVPSPPAPVASRPAPPASAAVPRSAGPSPAPDPAPARNQRVLYLLREQPGPLFGILDAARSPRVLEVLRDSGEEHQSLYEGAKGQELACVAPYLVRLRPAAPLLATLVQEGWGDSWGVYACCGQSFAEVRRHLRRFLLVRREDGKELYFRYYDPRVLRAYLPTCTPDEIRQFFGPVQAFLLEAEDAADLLLQFRPGRGGVERRVVWKSPKESPSTAPTRSAQEGNVPCSSSARPSSRR